MLNQKKKNYRLLLLKKESRKQLPNRINPQEIERNVSKSWFNRSLRNVSSIKNFSSQNYNITQTQIPIKIHNKSTENEYININKKYNKLLKKEDSKKFKYLNNEILDTIFSKRLNNSYINHTVFPRKNKLNLSSFFSLKLKKKHWRNKLANSLSLERQNSNMKKKKINESNKYQYIKSLLKNVLTDIKEVDLEKYSPTGKLALKIVDKLDVIEEHGNFKKYGKPENKFAKFKLLLNNQKIRNINLLREISDNRTRNEFVLKDYVLKLKKNTLI